MRKLGLLLFALLQAAGVQAQEAKPTTVVVLGVDHAAQLVARNDSPALLDAFLDKLDPDAICIERSPEAFARGDYYDFTYEVQDLVVPMARREGIELCAMDWMPPAEDMKLGFGLDLEAPPELRPAKGYAQFLSFERPSLGRDLFHADDAKNLDRVIRWAATPAAKTKDDLARRLYLYRTYMQAKRVAAAARAHPGGTVAVVVGEFHKHDIEAILKDDPAITLVQPSSLGRPSEAEAKAHDRREYQVAIARFNLLGAQAATGVVDFDYVRAAVEALEAQGDAAETRLLRVRLDLLQQRIGRKEAIAQYKAIAAGAGKAEFSWNGVKDKARVDSYFDPYGNLNVRQRALLEAARESHALGDKAQALKLRDECAGELTARQRAQLLAYWERDTAVATK
ncbi:hypothetical protein [Lysobacter silvisoli]|uniref:Haem-binding uptake Tiki superfamily ChaN domain-containing protein n=1 Tax=Lysobacter silvisoli TaxID=2293254 RepID=A0A371K4C5_9GAMM|nr:hypothetical protein [Lysobacter silvisoli]RDZ28712.1 hypothetical protein DX914_06190 [Lysobacter silvisoli]